MENNIEKILNVGQDLLRENNYENAKSYFQTILKIDSNNYFACEAMLKISCMLGDYNDLCFYANKLFLQNKISFVIKYLYEQLIEFKKVLNLKKIKIIIYVLNKYIESIEDASIKNIVLNELEIIEKRVILKSFPRMLTVSLTSDCNIRCKMCHIPQKCWVFPDKKIEEIVSFMPKIQTILWHGGEPFFYNKIDILINEAKKYNLGQIISTNGLLLDDKRIEQIMSSNMEINFSVHGLTKDVYEKIHCGGNFDKLINNLKKFKNFKDKTNSNIKYGIKFLIMKSNYKQFMNLYDFVKEFGFNHVYINTLGEETCIDENLLFHENKREVFKYISDISEELKFKFKEDNIFYEAWLPKCNDIDKKVENNKIDNNDNKTKFGCNKKCDTKIFEKEKKFCCYIPWQSLYIDAGGYVRNGCFCNDIILGNINENSLEEIWNNEQQLSIRKNIINNGFDNKCSIDCRNGRILETFLKNPVL
ncbi:MAG: radical SAM protein [Elusimicrobia bacterium]|nr:radical SAM protein [Elusimicrobiota bacterium]